MGDFTRLAGVYLFDRALVSWGLVLTALAWNVLSTPYIYSIN